MNSLKVHGQTVHNISNEAYRTGIVGILLSPFEVVKYILWAQQTGLSRTVNKKEYSLLSSCLMLIHENPDVLEDKIILDSATKVSKALEEFLKSSDELLDWERQNVSRSEKRKHKESISGGSFQISPWVAHPDSQVYLTLTTKFVSRYLESLEILVSHIEPMIIDIQSESLIN